MEDKQENKKHKPVFIWLKFSCLKLSMTYMNIVFVFILGFYLGENVYFIWYFWKYVNYIISNL